MATESDDTNQLLSPSEQQENSSDTSAAIAAKTDQNTQPKVVKTASSPADVGPDLESASNDA